MSSTEIRQSHATGRPSAGTVDMKLEVVVIPVSDVDRAKDFYVGLGWRLDADLGRSDVPDRPAHPAGLGMLDPVRHGRQAAAPGSAIHLTWSSPT